MDAIPRDVWLAVFEALEAQDLACAKCVCTTWRDLASSENMWFQAVAADFGQLGAFVGTQRIPSRTWSQRAKIMYQDPLYMNFRQMARLHALVRSTESWTLEIRKPGYQWNNDGELLFRSIPSGVHFMGQGLAFICDIPLEQLEAYSREWVYILGCDEVGDEYVLTCARLSMVGPRPRNEAWSSSCVLPRDGELRVVGHGLFTGCDTSGEPDGCVTVFAHYAQTIFGTPPPGHGVWHYDEMHSPRVCGVPNWLGIPNACVYMDVFDVTGVHHCSVVVNLPGWRQVPDRLTDFRPWFSVGLDALRSEAPKDRSMRLYCHVCIFELMKYRGTVQGKDVYDDGLFIEPLSWVECELRYRGDAPGPVGLRISGNGEFGMSCFECVVMGMGGGNPMVSLEKSRRTVRRGSGTLHWW
ncbi:unnamed protein product [Ostreobium quekettii]|uniref:F-box domain-containing protein n=1 Tax=Ostreobium quekettii TaxID=121088 RepID=A0A8S1J7T3_9CHLO|nr:unnamed protein product [Ostreobium quekettii]|eukprot:evm.model.scf_104.11 EVM.evm.TU.scf_104.11   scf_104:140882-143431(-)